MSRFSVPVHRQTHRTLIGEYKSRHRLHLSVVSQYMRRKSLKGLKLRLTLIVKATPPLWHTFLRHFHWVTHFLPEVPRGHLRRSTDTSIATKSSANSRSRKSALTSFLIR